jgi:hypothetical protein
MAQLAKDHYTKQLIEIYMSFTITHEKTTEYSHISLIAVKEKTEKVIVKKVSDQVQSLLIEMEASSLFSSKEKEAILSWKDQYDSKWLDDLSSDKEKEKVSLSLCILIFEVIGSAIANAKDCEEKQEDILIFEEAIKDILKETIPTGEEVDQFIEKFEQYSLEEKDFNHKVNQIDEIYDQILSQLYDSTDEMNQRLEKFFYYFKAEILHLQKQQQLLMKEGNEKLDKLIQKVDNASKELLGHTIEVLEVVEKMENDFENLQNILDNCNIKKITQ